MGGLFVGRPMQKLSHFSLEMGLPDKHTTGFNTTINRRRN